MRTNHFKSLIILILIVFCSKTLLSNIQDTIHLEETIITGTKTEINKKYLPLSISVVQQNEIEQSDETNILPVISKQVPGVFITQKGITGFGVSDGAAGQINIRGLGGSPTTQVLILLDGHPQFMGMMGHHLPDAYASSEIEKVEVIRGPASVLYGSNAFGGVINIISKKQHTDGYSANLHTMYGSFNTQMYSVNGGYKKNRFNIYAALDYNKTDGHRDTSDFNLKSAYIKTQYQPAKGISITADANITQFNSSDPGTEQSVAGETIDIKRGKAAISIENNYKIIDGALKYYYNAGIHDISDGWHSNDNMYGIMFYESIKPLSGNIISAGFDFMEYGGKGSPISTVIRDDNGKIIPNAAGFPQFVTSDKNNKWISTNNKAFYLNVKQILLNKFTINGGIRYETNSIYGSEWIPQAGISYCLTENTVFRSSVSKGYRPPSIRELYFFPPANDELNPERLINYEVSWEQHWLNNKVNTELTMYYIEGNNLIIMDPPVAPPPPLYKNSGSFRNRGIEFSGRYNITNNLHMHCNYAYIDMKTPLPSTPSQNLFVDLNYKIKKLEFTVQIQNIKNLYASINGKTKILEKSYSVLDTKIKYQVSEYLNIFISGNNILDTEYYIMNGYPMPGINFMAGLNINLKSKRKNEKK